MELSYDSRELRDLCLSDYLAIKKFGDEIAEKMFARLADFTILEVAEEIFSLPGNPRVLNGERKEQIAIDLSGDCGIVLKSGHGKKRLLESGDVDWFQIRRIKILAVENGLG